MPRVREGVTISAPRDEIYRFWRDLENLPRVMRHLHRVETIDARRSHWVARAPAGRRVEWDAEIVEDSPDTLIAWRSLPGAHVPNSGSVRFQDAPADRGTIVTVELEYRVPGGGIIARLANLFGEDPGRQLGADLRHFKQMLERTTAPSRPDRARLGRRRADSAR